MPAGFALTDAGRRIARAAVALTCLALLTVGIQQPLQASILIAIAVAAAIWPVAAVLATVAAIPVARVGAAQLAAIGGATVELLVLATASGYFARRAASSSPSAGNPAIRAALFVFAAIVAASLLVELAGVRVLISPQSFWPALTAEVTDVVERGRPDLAGRFSAIPAAFTLLEGLLLFAIVVTLERRETAVGVLRMFVLGATAAGLLNIVRFVGAVLRSEGSVWTALDLLRTVRISVAYGDVNAAGSFFGLALLTAIGFVIDARGRARAGYAAASVVCGMALWLSGSRAAFLALLVVLAAWLFWKGGRRARLALPVLVLVASIGVRAFPNPIIDSSSVGALSIRLELARASLRLLREAPLFGIGVGQFYGRSAEMIHDPSVKAIYPRENAHNNFLQILTELGVAGLAAFLLVVASVLLARRSSGALDGAHIAGATAGIAAFLITCLAGHPLLTPDVSLAFWIVLGALAASHQDGGRWRWTTPAMIALGLILLSVPFRVYSETRSLDLEHIAYGLSDWEYDASGDRFRRMTGRLTLFVPADATAIELPYRLVQGGEPVTIDVSFGGRRADRLIVTDSAWRTYRATPGASGGDAPFIPLELRVSSGSASSVGLGRLVTRREREGPR